MWNRTERALLVRPHRRECVAGCVRNRRLKLGIQVLVRFRASAWAATPLPVVWGRIGACNVEDVIGVGSLLLQPKVSLLARLGGLEDCPESPAAIRDMERHHFVIKGYFRKHSLPGRSVQVPLGAEGK